jgi:hypothetical protein
MDVEVAKFTRNFKNMTSCRLLDIFNKIDSTYIGGFYISRLYKHFSSTDRSDIFFSKFLPGDITGKILHGSEKFLQTFLPKIKIHDIFHYDKLFNFALLNEKTVYATQFFLDILQEKNFPVEDNKYRSLPLRFKYSSMSKNNFYHLIVDPKNSPDEDKWYSEVKCQIYKTDLYGNDSFDTKIYKFRPDIFTEEVKKKLEDMINKEREWHDFCNACLKY